MEPDVDAFEQARAAMVAQLRGLGRSTRSLDAVGRVRRELFVPSFFSFPPNIRFGGKDDVREWRVDGRDVDADAVALVYDAVRALGIARDDDGRTTSTVSAPNLLTAMLDMLELETGMRVLEIGAGSGYTAALLAEVVGDPSLVTTVDIDGHLVVEARRQLAAAGYPGVVVVEGDGDAGVPDRAPYDRIVATVGCLDVSPQWFDQLSPGGFALVPIQHGGVHPLHRVSSVVGGTVSQVVGRSGFVSVQGAQAATASPWPFAGRPGPREDLERRSLPAPMAAALQPEPGRGALGGTASWDFDFYLALRDHRAGHLGMLADADRSTAGVDDESAEVVFSGPSGPSLAEALVAHLDAWLGLGRPAASDYVSHWRPLDGGAADVSPGTDAVTGPWAVRRVHHRQVVELCGRAQPSGGSTQPAPPPPPPAGESRS